MTRGPAKPTSAPGSASMMSPSMANDAVTPPVVGSVSTLMKSPSASSNLASAADVFAICISERPDSCILAPPEQLTMISGLFSSVAFSIVLVSRSPTALPIDPMRKVRSSDATMARRPLM